VSYRKHTESYLCGKIPHIMSELELNVLGPKKDSDEKKIERLEKKIDDLHTYVGHLNERLNYLNEKIKTN
jgi:archaellum component FlaC